MAAFTRSEPTARPTDRPKSLTGLGCCTTRAASDRPDVEWFKFDWLYYFVVLVETGNFSEAAKHLFISQQALSKALAQLEKFLETPLLERRPWRLTPAGEQLLNESRRILSRANRLEASFLQQHQAGLKGLLRLALPGYLDSRLLRTCQELIQAYPELTIQMQTELGAEAIEQQLLSQQLEVAVLPGQPRSKGLKSLYYAASPMILVGAPNAFGCGQAHWQELSYIACQAPEPLGHLLQWPEAEFPRKVVAEADLQTALELAVAGQGVVCLPEHAVRKYLLDGTLYRLGSPPFQRRVLLSLVWATAQGHQPLIQKAIQALRPD